MSGKIYPNDPTEHTEIIYLTIWYACGHVTARPVRKAEHDPYKLAGDRRSFSSREKCALCSGIPTREIEGLERGGAA